MMLNCIFEIWYKENFNPKVSRTTVTWTSANNAYQWNPNGREAYLKDYKRLRSAHQRSWVAAEDVLRRFCSSTWWSWRAGSRPHFWRWPKHYVGVVRDGHPLWVISPLKPYRVPQRDAKDKQTKSTMLKKIDKV